MPRPRAWLPALLVWALIAGLSAAMVWTASPAAADPCGPDGNPVACENTKPGSPQADWAVNGSTYGDIVGYGTEESVRPGDSLPFKVKTPSATWEIEIYRLGWYGGDGARKVATVEPGVPQPQSQPACATEPATALVDCGTWAVSATWEVPADAVSGFYVANFLRLDAPGVNQFPFVVHDETSTSDLLVQTSDQTWQAYNKYGGNSLYVGTGPGTSGKAYAVSYNRPYLNSSTANFMNAEYPLVRWLERNGYDVSYASSIDVIEDPSMLLQHETFVSSGHDEYWTAQQRENVESARAAGVNLAFFSGNEVYWKTRFEPSIDGQNADNRTLICYKETEAAANVDPSPEWTGTWRDPKTSPPEDGGRPENALTGTLYQVNGYRFDAMKVPSDYSDLRFWANTEVAELVAGESATFANGTLGYEWDVDPANGFRPAGAVPMSSTTVEITEGSLLLDHGSRYGNGTATHSLVLYRDPVSGALVFGAGTVQWAWGLDDVHLNPNGTPSPPPDPTMQQATVNLLADMGAQPATLQPGLVAASATTDDTGPTATVTGPADAVPAGVATTITGTASDTGGGVPASVEVSVDGGQTWTRATPGPNGAWETWSLPWTPAGAGTAEIRVRASDDSANLGAVHTAAVEVTGTVNEPPTVTQTVPAPDATGVATTTPVTATFSEPVTAAGLTFTLSAGATPVAGSATLSGDGRTATFTPSGPLAAATAYTASVRATDPGGAQMPAPVTWSFTTQAGPGPDPDPDSYTIFGDTVPGTKDARDSQAVELGMRFVPTVDATVTGVRFYKSAANTGTHTGSVWTTDGALLATGTFTAETATGWQTLTLTTPVPVAANTTYIVSYFAPNGHYASTLDYFAGKGAGEPPVVAPASTANAPNGVYLYGGGFPTSTFRNANYWVDVVVTTEDVGPIPPTVTTTTPAANATGVAPTATASAVFSEPVDPATLEFGLSGPGGPVAASIALSSDGRTATLTPNAALAAATSYTASARASDLDGNPMPAPVTWSFTTAAEPGPGPDPEAETYTIFGDTLPGTRDSQDASAVELGVRFTPTVDAFVTGVRFYKSAANTGTHTGSVWTTGGQLLATGTFTAESASGWQTLTFDAAVPVAANTTYIASYFAPNGHYATALDYFAGNSAGQAPVVAPASNADAPNGVYLYGGGFPTSTFRNANYWVDVILTPAPAG